MMLPDGENPRMRRAGGSHTLYFGGKKMKKITALFLALLLTFSLLLGAVSCHDKELPLDEPPTDEQPSSEPAHPITAFRDKMVAAESAQMKITMTYPGTDMEITTTVKADGNITYMPATVYTPEMYIETTENGDYIYTMDENGKWVKVPATEEDDTSMDVDEISCLFVAENYDPVEGEVNTYRQKKAVVFEGFSDVSVYAGENTCTINAKMEMEGLLIPVRLVIFKVGEVKLTLPQVG